MSLFVTCHFSSLVTFCLLPFFITYHFFYWSLFSTFDLSLYVTCQFPSFVTFFSYCFCHQWLFGTCCCLSLTLFITCQFSSVFSICHLSLSSVLTFHDLSLLIIYHLSFFLPVVTFCLLQPANFCCDFLSIITFFHLSLFITCHIASLVTLCHLLLFIICHFSPLVSFN